MRRCLLRMLCCGCAALAMQLAHAEFVFYDFNATTGLVLNGDAATSSCARVPRAADSTAYVQNEYSEHTGANDVREATLEVVQHQLLEKVAVETVETENHTTSARVAVETASVGHRSAFEASDEKARCAVRLRLTASQPRQVASVWYAEPLPVLQGFETRFTFQLTDQSKRCVEVKDESFGVRHYRSCSVHGGDGFAFVLHAHGNKSSTLGAQQRGQLGYGGLENSLAIEFDTWFNTEQPDTFDDHVAIYSNGVSGNSLLESARLSATALHDLADGKVHVAKIRYYNEIKFEYAPYFSATTNLAQFIRDVSEGRRVGTLVVFMDDGVATDTPLIAIPINLAATLRLPADKAFVGFTASTGNSWQKHDVLGWYYCTQPPCLNEYGTEMTFEFDYNQQSMLSTASHGKSLYPIYIYPDTVPWARPQTYFANGQTIGLV